MNRDKNGVVQAYEILWCAADELDGKIEWIEEQAELIREWIDKKLKEIERLLPKDYRHSSRMKLDANGLLRRKAKRKKRQ